MKYIVKDDILHLHCNVRKLKFRLLISGVKAHATLFSCVPHLTSNSSLELDLKTHVAYAHRTSGTILLREAGLGHQ